MYPGQFCLKMQGDSDRRQNAAKACGKRLMCYFLAKKAGPIRAGDMAQREEADFLRDSA